MTRAMQMLGRDLADGGFDPGPTRPVFEARIPRTARNRNGATVVARLSGMLTVIVAAWWLTAGSAGPGARTIPVRPGSPGIPLAARGPVSAAPGRLEAAYAVIGLRARNPAQRLGATFSPAGATIAAGSVRVRLGLVGYGHAGALHHVTPAAPKVNANRVDYAHRGVEEWWANGPLGLEQGFDVRSRPTSGHGPLSLSLAVSGEVRARLTGSGVALEGRNGRALSYGGVSATDAHGRTLPTSLRLQSGRLVIHVDDSDAAYPVRVDPFIQQAELTLSDGVAGDGFAAVAISGDTLAVGAPGRKVDANAGQGAVYVFQKPASGWAHATPVARLTASDGAASDGLSSTVAVSADTIVAGASNHKVGANAFQGAAYVFVQPASGWTDATQTAELTASDGNVNDGFPSQVGVSGDTIVAGPNQHDVDGNFRQGEAYVFVKPAAGWSNTIESAKLRASDGVAGDEFGRAVAISGDTIVVGAANHKVGDNADQGTVYVFSMPQGMVSIEGQRAELTATDGGATDLLGSSVAISGDVVVAGAPNHQVGLSRQGAAYVFVRASGGFFPISATQTAELTASDGVTSDGLGDAVAVSGDEVVVSSSGHQVAANQLEGAAYVFSRPGFVWANATETAELTAPDGVASDFFGVTLGISGNFVAVGGGVHPVGDVFPGKGAAYLFAAPPQIGIGTPANGTTFTQGQVVAASFSCTPPGGATITTCAGPVARGAPIDTNSLGPHTFTVDTVDSDGVTATRTVNYTVATAPGSSGPTSTAPSITAVHQSAPVWRRGGKLARTASARKPPIGTTFSFAIDQAATVTSRAASRPPTSSSPDATRSRSPRPTPPANT